MTTQLPQITQTIEIEASQQQVWRCLTEPSKVSQWLGCLRYRKEIGHIFYMQPDENKRGELDIEGATHCRILALNEPREFSFSWYMPGTPETTVRILLKPHDSDCVVALEHSGWEQFEPDMIREIRDGLEEGWKSFVLPALKKTVETRKIRSHKQE
ncbi:MAG TPA: SRPBCC domain-containing protein [Xanthomonadales bacterium]|nr:SRPBCC domain-containing protein [Xanthomonadales bacterium]